VDHGRTGKLSFSPVSRLFCSMALGGHGSSFRYRVHVFVLPCPMSETLFLDSGVGIQRLQFPAFAPVVDDVCLVSKLGVGGPRCEARDLGFRWHSGLMSKQEYGLHRIQPRYRRRRVSNPTTTVALSVCDLYRIFRAFRDAVKRHNCGDAVLASS